MSNNNNMNNHQNTLGYLAFFLLLFTLFVFNFLLKYLFGYGLILKTLTRIGYTLSILCGILSFVVDYKSGNKDKESTKNGNFAGAAIFMAMYLILVSIIKI